MRLCQQIEKRLQLMIEQEWSNKEAKRLVKRLPQKGERLRLYQHLRKDGLLGVYRYIEAQ
jgi:hypothetical protein